MKTEHYFTLMRKAYIIKFQIHFDEKREAEIRKYYLDMHEFLEFNHLDSFFETFLQILSNVNLLDYDILRRNIYIMLLAYFT